MKILLPSFVFVIIIVFFAVQNMPRKSKLRIINVMDTYVARDSVRLLVNDSTGFNLVYYDDIEIYEEPILQYVTDSTKIKGDSIINIGHESKDTVFNYFITKKGADKALMYESLDSKKYVVIDRDSLLRIFNSELSDFTTLNLDLGPPSKTIRNKKTNLIEIEHFAKKNPPAGYADTISRYYDVKLKDINYSFSPSLDKEKKSKLVKTKFITLPRRTKQKNGKVTMSPYIEDTSMMRETKARRMNIYLGLIKRFEKDSKHVIRLK